MQFSSELNDRPRRIVGRRGRRMRKMPSMAERRRIIGRSYRHERSLDIRSSEAAAAAAAEQQQPALPP